MIDQKILRHFMGGDLPMSRNDIDNGVLTHFVGADAVVDAGYGEAIEPARTSCAQDCDCANSGLTGKDWTASHLTGSGDLPQRGDPWLPSTLEYKKKALVSALPGTSDSCHMATGLRTGRRARRTDRALLQAVRWLRDTHLQTRSGVGGLQAVPRCPRRNLRRRLQLPECG